MKQVVIMCLLLSASSAFSQYDDARINRHTVAGTSANVRRSAARVVQAGSSFSDSLSSTYQPSVAHTAKTPYAVKAVNFNGPGMDFSPFPYRDGLVFVSSRPKKGTQTGDEIFLNLFFTAEREDGTFATPEPLEAGVVSPYHEGPVVFFSAGTKKIFTRNAFQKKSRLKDGAVNPLELAASELTMAGKWSEPIALPFVSAEYSVAHPAITSDGKTIYFSSNMPGSLGGSDIFVSTFENDQWTTPRNLGPHINTAGQELFPTLYKDSILAFASAGRGGLGGLDIFYCDLRTKQVRVSTFPAPVNSSADDFGMFFEEGAVSGFFSSNREDGQGQDDIYYFEEIQPFVSIQIFDNVTRHPIDAADITVSAVNATKNLRSDLFGRAETRLRPFGGSTVTVSKEGYEPSAIEVDPESLAGGKEKSITVYLRPYEAHTRPALAGLNRYDRSGVTNVISFSSSPLDVDLAQPEEEPVTKEESDSLSIASLKVIAVEVINDMPAIMLVKNDSIYEASRVSETTIGNSMLQLQINIPNGAKRHDYEEIIRKQIASQGYDISRFLLIRSFFFDSGKTWVRNDASAQLDKIIEVMVNHPEVNLQMTFHADARGTDAFNLELSKARAEEVITYLGKSGITRGRISSKFVGESQPLNDCGDLSDCDELIHQINRTAEFKFLLR